jgi:Flp pilus assembly protein TadD
VLEENPQHGHLHIALALAHGRAGRWQEALDQAPKSSEGPEEWQWWPVLALVHFRLGHAEEARRWLAKAAEKSRQFPQGPGAILSEAEMDFRILYAEAASAPGADKP